MLYRYLRATLIYLISIFYLIPDVYGQDSTSTATLLQWEQRIQNFMLDRSHNYGGTHFSRGLFREHINEMSPEHTIDLMTYRFTLIEDYQWENIQSAYRLSMGSLNATNFAIENSIKNNISINDKNRVSIEGYHAENLRANRFLFHLGYEHKIFGKHHVGVRHTLTKEKSDLDATFFYRYGHFENGMIEVSFTAMDWASNVVQRLAKNSRNEWNQRYEVTHQYSEHPELLSVKLVSPQSYRFKTEFFGGVQTYSRKRVEVHADTSQFIDEEWAHYLGGLLEYNHPHYTIGVTYQRTFSKLRRVPTADSSYDLNFANRQVTNQLGVYMVGRLRSFRLEHWMWYGYDHDRLQGEKVPGDLQRRGFERVPFDYQEEPLKIKSRLWYDPVAKGLKTGLEFHAEYSRPQGKKINGVVGYDFRRTYSIVRDYNARLTYTVGYRFLSNFYLLAGISYDLDGDKQSGRGTPKISGDPTWFDGAFGRFSISW